MVYGKQGTPKIDTQIVGFPCTRDTIFGNPHLRLNSCGLVLLHPCALDPQATVAKLEQRDSTLQQEPLGF